MRTLLIALVIIVIALAARAAWIVLPAAGTFANLEQTGLDGCEALTIAPGTEDVTIHPVTGLAYVSAAERRGGDGGANGIWAFDPADPQMTLRKVSDGPEDFHPHGISLLTRDNAPDRLFAINHPRAGGHRVEIFEIGTDGALSHIESITYPDLSSPNDLLAVGPRSFYATNDRRYQTGILSTLEAFLGLPLGGVSFFDGQTGSIAADGLVYANGIAMAPDGRTIYVAELLTRRVNVYRRDGADGRLERIDRIAAHTGPDNIEIGPQGDLWIGAHPNIFALLDHAEDPDSIAPSEVIRVDPDTGAVSRELMALNGELNASSVGAISGTHLIVGAVFDERVLICPRS